MHENEIRKRWRRKRLAEFFDVNPRTIDLWARTGVIPPAHYLAGSSIPFWYDDEISAVAISQKTVTA
jgi:hypothetical protein